MRKTLAILLLLTLSPGMVAMAQDRRADEEHVRSLDDQERIAALKRDIPALERLWSEDLTVNAPASWPAERSSAASRTSGRTKRGRGGSSCVTPTCSRLTRPDSRRRRLARCR